MPSGNLPAARRFAWLITLIGGLSMAAAIIALVASPDQGIRLPLTHSALDSGWLLLFGIVWVGVGVLSLWWLRSELSAAIPAADSAQSTIRSEIESRLAQITARLENLESRMADMTDKTNLAKRPQPAPKLQTVQSVTRDLDTELGNLATSIEDAHNRLDTVDDVSHRLQELTSQIDELYVMLHDAHRRLDSLE